MSNANSNPAPGVAVAATPLPLDPTGVPGLDLVLGGGLRRGSLLLLVGPPGSGKTTLAGQLAFAAAKAGRRVLVLTALSEPVGKLLTHLRTLTFFEEELVGDQIRLHSLQQFLPQGLASTGRELAAIVRAERAGLVVLDGFGGLRAADAGGPPAARRFLYDLGTALSLQGATTVLTSEGRVHDPSVFGETTTADAIVGMDTAHAGVRSTRWLEVVKARGSDPLTGRHGLTLGAAGAAVHPRLEARVTPKHPGSAPDAVIASPVAAPGDGPEAPPLTFGQAGLDAVLGPAVLRDTTTLIVGPPGAGKTLLGLHFALAGASSGQPALYLSLRETRRQLLRKTAPFALGPSLRAALLPDGGLTLLWRPAVELDIELLADELLASLDRTGAKRLVVDSIGEWERAVAEGGEPRRVANHLSALVQALHARAVTSLFLREGRAADAVVPEDPLVTLAENVVVLGETREKGRVHRVLSLPKLRLVAQDPASHEFVIAAPDGLRVIGAFRRDAGVLEALSEAVGKDDAERATPS